MKGEMKKGRKRKKSEKQKQTYTQLGNLGLESGATSKESQ